MSSSILTVRGFLSLIGGILTGTVAYASASMFVPMRVQPHADPGPDTTTWILVGTATKKYEKATKRSIGAQLHAPLTNPQSITPALNPTLQANGQIAGPGPFKDCACIWHYHGSLLGVPDPDPRHCGWGCAAPFDRAGDAAGFLSGATMLEARAAAKISATPADYAGALQDVEDSHDQLNGLVEALDADVQSGKISERTARKITKSAVQAANADEAAQAELTKLINHQGGNAQRAVSDLLRGVGQKQKAMVALSAAQDLNQIH